MANEQAGPWRRLAVLLVCLGIASGCGARWSDDQRAEVLGRQTSGLTRAVAAGSTAPGAATPGAAGGTAAAQAGSSSPSAAGAATSAGQSTTGAGGAASGPLPCAAHSDAPGVTDDTITVANISSISGILPGLGASAQAATRAYVARVNAEGGLCGRQVAVLTADDAGDGGQFRSLVTDLAPKALGLAGIFSPVDGGGADIVAAQGMPVVSSIGTAQLAAVPTVFNINPPPADPHAPIGQYTWLYDQGVRTAAIVTLAADAAVLELNRHQAQMEGAGIKVVSRQILPVTTLSFDSAARVVANSGADYLFFLAAAQHDAGMARAMRDTGYSLKFEEYLTGYGSNYTELAGDAAGGTSSWIRMLPTEDSGNAEQAAFLSWMAQTAPDQPTDVFATDAWAATKAFFDAITQLPGPISRAALVDQLHATSSYDADGLIGPLNLGANLSNGCLVGMRFDSGQWHRMVPDHGFLC